MVVPRRFQRCCIAFAGLFILAWGIATVVYSQQKRGNGEEQGFWRSISWLLGWVYFFAWSVSFYPQLLLNYKRKSTEGLSYNFVWLNFLGFVCYSIFNIAFYSSDSVQESYKNKHNENNFVKLNDVFFAVHAAVLTGLTLIQGYFCGYRRASGVLVWLSVRVFIVASTVLALGYFISVFAHGNKLWEKGRGGANFWTMLSWLNFVSYIKLVVSFIKYCPQVYLNYKRQSTEGWSLANVLLDFTGGILSFVQLFIDASLENKWKSIVHNPVKFGLSILSVVFDIIFMVQHYVLYPRRQYSIPPSQDETVVDESEPFVHDDNDNDELQPLS